jgi:hypothetical protein
MEEDDDDLYGGTGQQGETEDYEEENTPAQIMGEGVLKTEQADGSEEEEDSDDVSAYNLVSISTGRQSC